MPTAGTLENQNSCGTQSSTNDPKDGTDASIALAPPLSRAAKFNTHTLKRLQAVFDNDPEADLLTNLFLNYSIRLAKYQKDSPKSKKKKPRKQPVGSMGEQDLKVSMADI